MIFATVILTLATVTAVPDCYLPFLTATTTCNTASDCTSGACVYSLNRMQRVCCEANEGAVQPECSSGKPAPLPILCDPNSNEMDICPDDYECRESTTNFEKSNGEPNYLCCR
ncbi:hypothetical protein ANCCAN_25676 [Ancylostoma caninum]|uniref:Uncharacterized protein n=1 Tax=Ancylostoma caninum TaxID=29170 RepID=A0A368FC40_ANCCA|nr:hypothetical protein ANCCAN_25676 [Ancylostoma caninum]